jgi:hypothetical protein
VKPESGLVWLRLIGAQWMIVSLEGKARKCVKMVLLTKNTERVIEILRKNYGNPDVILNQLIEEVQQQCPVKESRHFQEFANAAVENLSVNVENFDGMSNLTSNLIIKEFLKKFPEYLRLQWKQFVVQKQLCSPNMHQFAKWVSEQNKIGGENSK